MMKLNKQRIIYLVLMSYPFLVFKIIFHMSSEKESTIKSVKEQTIHISDIEKMSINEKTIEIQFRPPCPKKPSRLFGQIPLDKNKTMKMNEVERRHFVSSSSSSSASLGGFNYPLHCAARHRVAIIIPFRDRDWHFAVLINHLLPILKRQLLAFQIYVVELAGGGNFNRGMLMNIGFAQAIKVGNAKQMTAFCMDKDKR